MNTDLILRIYVKARQPKKVDIKPVRTHYNSHSFG